MKRIAVANLIIVMALIGFMSAFLLESRTTFANEDLYKKNNCSVCHQMDKKGIGLSIYAISAKYKSDSNGQAKIIAAIKNGSKGIYGRASVMAPMPQVSEADAKALAEWILSLTK